MINEIFAGGKLNSDEFLKDMYDDEYFPKFLVDKLKEFIIELTVYLETGSHSLEEIQQELDELTRHINDMQAEFEESDSEIETAARESIMETIKTILIYFDVNINIDDAVRQRNW
ncbi:MAG: DUF5713 family protein [Bacillota bacterium]|nr:DUF5713 family protein [Bacillota bacterium]